MDRFMAGLLEPGDEGAVAVFSHLTRILTPWTSPPAGLAGRLDDERPFGGTAIYDALVAVAPMFSRRHRPRGALVVVSDGADTASDRGLAETREMLRRLDAFVYAIAIDASTERRASTRVNPAALQEITAPSGGYTEVVHGYDEIGPATSRIAEELSAQYTLAFSTSKPQDGSWRSLRVRVKGQDYLARARRGYYAGTRNRP